MVDDDKKIEAFLKSRIESVRPSRSVFENVTNKLPNRNSGEKLNYQLTTFSMSKFLKIGVPIALIAIVAIVAVGKPKTETLVINDDTSAKSATESKIQNSPEIVVNKDSSGDEILASFFADAEADAVVASSESEDETYMNSQIDAFISFNQTNYENI